MGADFYSTFLAECRAIAAEQEKVASGRLAGARAAVKKYLDTEAHPAVAEGVRKGWGHLSGNTVKRLAKEHAGKVRGGFPAATHAAPHPEKTEKLQKLLTRGKVSRNVRFGERGVQTRSSERVVGGWGKPTTNDSPANKALRQIARARTLRDTGRAAVGVGSLAAGSKLVGSRKKSKASGTPPVSRYY